MSVRNSHLSIDCSHSVGRVWRSCRARSRAYLSYGYSNVHNYSGTYSNRRTYANPNTNTNAYSYANAYTNCYTYTYAYSYNNTDPDTYPDS